MTVLIFGNSGPGQSEPLPEFTLLEEAVERTGESAVLVDGQEWPGPAKLLYGTDDSLAIGESVRIDNVTAAYFSFFSGVFDPGSPAFSDQLDADPKMAVTASSEYSSVFKSTARVIADSGATVVPSPSAIDLQRRKPWQLFTLKRNGLPVPETIFTNSTDETRQFIRQHDRTVVKPVTKGALTQEITTDDLDSKAEKLKSAPVQVQEFIEGRDLRIYVVDGEIVGSFHYPSERISWKHDVIRHGEEIAIDRITPPERIKQAAIKATELLDLGYGAVDLIDREDGSFALLEVNETPRFAAPQRETNVEVADQIAEYLVETTQ